MELASFICALLGLSVCAKLPDTNSGDRVNLTEYQEELLNRTNRIVADKLANLTSFLKYYKRVVVEKSSENERMILLTIRQIERLRPTKDKEAECLSQKTYHQNQLRLFAAALTQEGLQRSLAEISRKMKTSIENFKKRNTLTASDSDEIPRNPADERDFLHQKLYDINFQMMRELMTITLEYFYQQRAELYLSHYIVNGTMKQINSVCGTMESVASLEDEIDGRDEFPERLQRLLREGPDVLLVQTDETAGPERGKNEDFIDFKLRRLSETLADFSFKPPCNSANVENTSWGNDQAQLTVKNQLIGQWFHGCLRSPFNAKDHYRRLAYLEKFRAPMGSRDGLNKLINELDYENSVLVSMEPKRHKLEFLVCSYTTAPLIFSELASVVQITFRKSCGDATN